MFIFVSCNICFVCKLLRFPVSFPSDHPWNLWFLTIEKPKRKTEYKRFVSSLLQLMNIYGYNYLFFLGLSSDKRTQTPGTSSSDRSVFLWGLF